jgi:hypothetical protein
VFGNRIFGRAGGFYGLADPILRSRGGVTGSAAAAATATLTLFGIASALGSGLVLTDAVLITAYASGAALGSAATTARPLLRLRLPAGVSALGTATATLAVAALRTTGHTAAAVGGATAAQIGTPLFHFTGRGAAVGSAATSAQGFINDTLFARITAVGVGTAVVLVGAVARSRSGGGLLLVTDPSHTAATDARTYASAIRLP